MTFLKFCGVIIAALAVAALWGVGAAANYAHALHKAGTSPWAAILASASVMADVLKVVAALAVGYALRRRQWIGTSAALVIWACAAGWAAQSALGFVSVTFADSSAKRGTVASGETSVAAQLKAEVARLAWLNGQITDARGKDLERFNAEVNRTRASLDQLRQQNAAATGVSSADPAADFLAKHFGIANATTDLVIVLWFLALVEIVGNLGPSMVRGLMAQDPAPAKTGATVASAPALMAPATETPAATMNDLTVDTVAAPATLPPGPLRVVGGTAMASTPQVTTPPTVASVMSHTVRPSTPKASKGPLALAFDSSTDPLEAVEIGQIERPVLTAASVLPFPVHAEVATVSAVDPVATFAATRIERRDGSQVQASTLHDSFTAWCRATGNEPLNATVFGLAMGALGFSKIKTSRVHYCNIALMN
jgi:hypothetical protein